MENIFKEVKTNIEFNTPPNLNFLPHIHEDIELVYVKKGRCKAVCDGKEYVLEDNSFFLTSPYQIHQYFECINGEYMLLIINPKKLLRYSDVFVSGVFQTPVFSAAEDLGIPRLMEEALSEYEENGYSGIVDGYLMALFGKLLRFYKTEKAEKFSGRRMEILEYCLSHYMENLTVDDIARGLNVSRSSISHIFIKCFGTSFCNYINSLRLFQAVELLKNSSLSITEIALSTGFSNLRTFNRAFFKQYGMSPTVYKKTQLNLS